MVAERPGERERARTPQQGSVEVEEGAACTGRVYGCAALTKSSRFPYRIRRWPVSCSVNREKEITHERAFSPPSHSSRSSRPVAVAHLKSGDVTAVSATLSATTPSNVQTRTYTCAGQTFEVTTGRWTGLSTSTTPDQRHGRCLKSVYNGNEEARRVDGQAQIRGRRTTAAARVSGREHRRQARRLAAPAAPVIGRDHLRQPDQLVQQDGWVDGWPARHPAPARMLRCSRSVSTATRPRRSVASVRLSGARLGRVDSPHQRSRSSPPTAAPHDLHDRRAQAGAHRGRRRGRDHLPAARREVRAGEGPESLAVAATTAGREGASGGALSRSGENSERLADGSLPRRCERLSIATMARADSDRDRPRRPGRRDRRRRAGRRRAGPFPGAARRLVRELRAAARAEHLAGHVLDDADELLPVF